MKTSTTYHERIEILGKIMVLLVIALAIRLFYVQVVRHSHYESLANAEHQKKFVLPAKRGVLYFMDGDKAVPAVMNDYLYSLYVDPTIIKNPDEAARIISGKLDLKADDLKEKMKKEKTAYVVVANRLTKEQVDDLFQEKEKLKGVGVTPVPQRVYPEKALASQVLGFVNNEGDGQYGVEGFLNDRLSGTDGSYNAVTDVNGIPLSLDDSRTVRSAPKNGEDLVLTIDRNVQSIAEQALLTGLRKSAATKGSVIVIDPTNGAVRAMANLPTYDATEYYKVTDNAYEKFQNRVVSNPYEPGSVIKVLTMAAGLDTGSVQFGSTYYNSGFVKVADAEISNVNQLVNGNRSMTDVLKYSLNTGVVHILGQMGGGTINSQARDRLYNYFHDRYRFAQKTGIEQVGEGDGTLFAPDAEQGNNVRYSNMTFGQGMNITMLQTVAAFSAIMNGGNYYSPYLVEGRADADGHFDPKNPKPAAQKVISEGTSKDIKRMLRNAFFETATVRQFARDGYDVAGKSGTSETIDPRTGKYTTSRTIGSYLGYGGDTNGLKYVIMVRIDDSTVHQFGSESAGPVFGEISNKLIDYYGLGRVE